MGMEPAVAAAIYWSIAFLQPLFSFPSLSFRPPPGFVCLAGYILANGEGIWVSCLACLAKV